jgi:plasmid stabilization system protein ParE
VKVEYKPTYFDDLEDIKNYITDNFNERLAMSIVAGIKEDCDILAEQPNLGRVYSRNPFFRTLIVKRKNILFYHIDSDKKIVTLHRIFDGRRDYISAVQSTEEQ